MGDSIPYVYKLVHKESGEFYIGYRSANKLPAHLDLPQYQTSSKIVKEIGFNNFNWEIIAEFHNWEAAYDFESELIRENINDPLCINGHYFESGSNRFVLKKHTTYAKNKISNSLKGKAKTAEHKDKLSKANSGKSLSDVTKSKMSKAKLGKPRDAATRARMSEARKRYWANKKLNQLKENIHG